MCASASPPISPGSCRVQRYRRGGECHRFFWVSHITVQTIYILTCRSEVLRRICVQYRSTPGNIRVTVQLPRSRVAVPSSTETDAEDTPGKKKLNVTTIATSCSVGFVYAGYGYGSLKKELVQVPGRVFQNLQKFRVQSSRTCTSSGYGYEVFQNLHKFRVRV